MLRVMRVIVCLGFVFIFFASPGQAFQKKLICDLMVNNVGPKPADTKARGNVVFLFDDVRKELSYKIQVEDIKDAYMAHIHIGSTGTEGPIAAWLYPIGDSDTKDRLILGKFTGTLAEGVVEQKDLSNGITLEELLEALQKGNAYVNVHTKSFFMGAIRGQVYSQDYLSSQEQNPTQIGIP